MFIDVCWSCSPKTGVELAVIAFFAPGTVQKSPELAENAGKWFFEHISTLEKHSLLKFCTPMQNSITWIVIQLDFMKSEFSSRFLSEFNLWPKLFRDYLLSFFNFFFCFSIFYFSLLFFFFFFNFFFLLFFFIISFFFN